MSLGEKSLKLVKIIKKKTGDLIDKKSHKLNKETDNLLFYKR